MHGAGRAFTVCGVVGALWVSSSAYGQSICGEWAPLVEGITPGFPTPGQDRISQMAVFDAGDGPMLYVVGNFQAIIDPVFGEVRSPAIARWDGERWLAVPGLDGPGLEPDGRAITLMVWDDGAGPALYVGGEFTTIAGLEAEGIARFDASGWSTLGEPTLGGVRGRVLAIHAHDFGDGEALYVGGEFVDRGTTESAGGVQRWSGSTWSPVGDDAPPKGGAVYGLASFGGDLFASGNYYLIGDEIGGRIARFDGVAWTRPVGPDQELFAADFWPMLPWTYEGRPVLAAGGRLTLLQGGEEIARDGVIVWDGQAWRPLSAVWETFHATDLVVFDDGGGEALFAGGNFILSSNGVAKYQDGRFVPIRTSDIGVHDLLVYDDGTRPALLASGWFDSPSRRSGSVARWAAEPLCRVDVNNDCTVDADDFAAFLFLFSRENPRADMDRDGAFTLFDYLEFQNQFVAGCP